MRPLRPIVLLLAGMLAACSLSPLQNRIHPGDEAFLIVVGTGADQHVDLFAMLPGGGEVFQITFTAMPESQPRLTRHGDVVAFLRRGQGSTRPDGELVLMNLLNGAERRLAIPDSAGQLQSIGWSQDERNLFIATATGPWRVEAPPAEPNARPVSEPDRAAADSALDVWVGTPRFALVGSCEGGGVCITGPSQEPLTLSPIGAKPTRWGSDSVAWLEGDQVVIRPLGPGPVRRLDLNPKRVHSLGAVSYAAP